jgi:hypothetical protein
MSHLAVIDMQRVFGDPGSPWQADDAGHRKALDIMALYGPLITVVTVGELFG